MSMKIQVQIRRRDDALKHDIHTYFNEHRQLFKVLVRKLRTTFVVLYG